MWMLQVVSALQHHPVCADEAAPTPVRYRVILSALIHLLHVNYVSGADDDDFLPNDDPFNTGGNPPPPTPPVVVGGVDCSSNSDCYRGVCQGGLCTCDAGWASVITPKSVCAPPARSRRRGAAVRLRGYSGLFGAMHGRRGGRHRPRGDHPCDPAKRHARRARGWPVAARRR